MQSNSSLLKTMKGFMKTINSKSSDKEEIKTCLSKICEKFYQSFDIDKVEFENLQKISFQIGLVEKVCLFAGLRVDSDSNDRNTDFLFEETALHCLKWIILDNKDSCKWLFQQTDIMEILSLRTKSLLPSNEKEEKEEEEEESLLSRNEATLRLINTFSRTMIESHQMIIQQFTKYFIELIKIQKVSSKVKSQSVTHLLILSSNPTICPSISQACEPLIEIAKLQEPSQNSVGALIAAANICFGNFPETEITDSTPPVILNLLTINFLTPLKLVLERTLVGEDYPEGSKRYYTPVVVCEGIANICKSPEGCATFQRLKIMKVLNRAKKLTDIRVREYSQISLELMKRHPIPEMAQRKTLKIEPFKIDFKKASLAILSGQSLSDALKIKNFSKLNIPNSKNGYEHNDSDEEDDQDQPLNWGNSIPNVQRIAVSNNMS